MPIREASNCSRWWLMKKPITLQSADSEWKRSAQALSGAAVSLPPSPDNQRRKGGKNIRARRWGGVQGKMCSGHRIVFVHMNSLYMWLSAQDLHEIRLISFSLTIGEWQMWPHPLPGGLWAVMIVERGVSVFVVVIIIAPGSNSSPIIGQSPIKLSGVHALQRTWK